MKSLLTAIVLIVSFLAGIYFGVGGFMLTRFEAYNVTFSQYEQEKRVLTDQKKSLQLEIKRLEQLPYDSIKNMVLNSKKSQLATAERTGFRAFLTDEDDEPTFFMNEEHFNMGIELVRLNSVFSSLYKLPIDLIYFITSCAFGLLGGIIRVVREITVNRTSLTFRHLQYPIMGLMLGILVLGASYLLPTVLASGSTEINSTTLMFLSLFAGLFSDVFFAKLEASFKKFLKS